MIDTVEGMNSRWGSPEYQTANWSTDQNRSLCVGFIFTSGIEDPVVENREFEGDRRLASYWLDCWEAVLHQLQHAVHIDLWKRWKKFNNILSLRMTDQKR